MDNEPLETNFTEKIAELEATLQTAETEDSSTFNELVKTLIEAKEYEKATTLLTEKIASATTIEPENASKWYANLGLLSIVAIDNEQALKHLEKALEYTDESQPIYAKIHFRLGIVHTEEKQLEKAVEHYTIAIDWGNQNEQPSAEGYYNLAITYLQMEAIEEAAECLETALEINEEVDNSTLDSLDISLQLGEVYTYQKEWTKALTQYHYASEDQEDDEDPNIGKTYYKMTQVLLSMDKFTKGIEYYEKAIPYMVGDLEPDQQSDLHFQLANLYVDYKDDFQKALEHYKAAKAYTEAEETRDETYQMNLAKLTDSVALMEEKLAAAKSKPKTKKGFFGRLFGG